MSSSEPNPFDAFYSRVRRRLQEKADSDDSRFRAIEVRLAQSYASGATIKAMAAEISDQMHEATDWALAETDNLPGQRYITRRVVLPVLTSVLSEHLGNLRAHARWGQIEGMADRIGAPTRAAADQLYAKIPAALKGELDDFAAGVWSPRAPVAAAVVAHAPTYNEVNIHGSLSGIVQQAGFGSSQQASFTASPDEVWNAIRSLREAISCTKVDPEAVRELEGDIVTIEAQLSKARPNLDIMREAASALSNLALGVAGGLLTPPVQALLHSLGLG